MKLKKVGLFGRIDDSSVSGALSEVRRILEGNNLEVLLGETTSEEIPGERIPNSDQPLNEVIDLAIVVGAPV